MTTPVLTDPFVLYQSTLLSTYTERLIHGFSGKPLTLGGPQGPTEAIWENRYALCRQFGLNAEHLVLPKQIHTDRYRLNEAPPETTGAQDGADAVILTQTGIAAMVQVADCVPIILYAPDIHAGAVIHAGWRGTGHAIAQKVAQVLIRDFKASADRMLAVIGPSIGGCCYEVSEEVTEAVSATIPMVAPERYSEMQENGKPRVDLKQVNAWQLKSLGIHQIEIMEACTRCEPEHLWSYRRGEDGRQVAFLQLK